MHENYSSKHRRIKVFSSWQQPFVVQLTSGAIRLKKQIRNRRGKQMGREIEAAMNVFIGMKVDWRIAFIRSQLCYWFKCVTSELSAGYAASSNSIYLSRGVSWNVARLFYAESTLKASFSARPSFLNFSFGFGKFNNSFRFNSIKIPSIIFSLNVRYNV